MIIKIFTTILLVGICSAYYTNVLYKYVWTTKSIEYFAWDENPDKIVDLEALISLTLSTLEKDVGPLITWKRVPSDVAQSKDRYVMFGFAESECITSNFASKGGSIIPLSYNENGCDIYTNIHNILTALG
uniref:Uncharacterized protein n=1 Tax=Panagrolaimus superbus TaxID=310955 RepID=A0A914XV89_9BILA